MCIYHIACLVIDRFNSRESIILSSKACLKVSEFFHHSFVNCIFSINWKFTHKLSIFSCIRAAQLVNEPLKIAWNKYVHTWGYGECKFSLSVIGAALKEVIQDFVGIWGTYKSFYRKSYFFCKIRRKNISKITCWHTNIYFFTWRYPS